MFLAYYLSKYPLRSECTIVYIGNKNLKVLINEFFIEQVIYTKN